MIGIKGSKAVSKCAYVVLFLLARTQSHDVCVYLKVKNAVLVLRN